MFAVTVHRVRCGCHPTASWRWHPCCQPGTAPWEASRACCALTSRPRCPAQVRRRRSRSLLSCTSALTRRRRCPAQARGCRSRSCRRARRARGRGPPTSGPACPARGRTAGQAAQGQKVRQASAVMPHCCLYSMRCSSAMAARQTRWARQGHSVGCCCSWCKVLLRRRALPASGSPATARGGWQSSTHLQMVVAGRAQRQFLFTKPVAERQVCKRGRECRQRQRAEEAQSGACCRAD